MADEKDFIDDFFRDFYEAEFERKDKHDSAKRSSSSPKSGTTLEKVMNSCVPCSGAGSVKCRSVQR
jgi:hypothetical protein